MVCLNAHYSRYYWRFLIQATVARSEVFETRTVPEQMQPLRPDADLIYYTDDQKVCFQERKSTELE